MKSHLYSLLKFLIGLPLTLLALFFMIKIIGTQAFTLRDNLHSVDISLLLYGILSFLIFYFLRSYLWHRILRQYHSHIAFRESNYLWAISELKRYIPGNIWSFLGRTVLFQKKGIEKKNIAKGLIIEAELFILGCAIISLFALPFFFSRDQMGYEWLIGLLIALVTVLYCFNKPLQLFIPQKIRKGIVFLLPQFVPTEIVLLVWVSAIALFFFGLGNYFVIAAVLYLTPSLLFQLIGIFTFAFVVGYLSIITPAGFGVREGVTIIALTRIISSGLAAFGALFSRFILIISELLFIIISYAWYRMHNRVVSRLEKLIVAHPQVSLLIVLTVIYTIYFTVVSFLRYDNYYTGRFDLGNMAQTVWNSLHGKIFLFTNPNGTEQISRLAFHADFILILLAPFYALWQDPKMLLLIQTGIVATGAFFVYIIARDVLNNRNLALTFAFVYLLNPSVQRANIFDFHAVTLVTTFFLATYYFFLKKRYVFFILFAVLAALCKEQVWLIIAMFGLLVMFAQRKIFVGAGLFLFSIFMFYFLFWYAIPHTLGSQHFALAYLSDFGDSPTRIVKSIVSSPEKIIQTILQPSRLDYLTQIFMPVGYLTFFFPFFLIFAGPDLLIDILSNNPQLHQIYYQYTATITPFIFLGAIYGSFWLRKGVNHYFNLSNACCNLLLIIYLFAVALYGAYSYGPLPSAHDPNLDMFTKQLSNRDFIENYLKSIPKKDSVAASNAIGSHLSLRENIYTVPYGLDRADIVILLFMPSDPQAKDAYKRVSKDPHYHKVVEKDNFVAFQRN